MTVTQTELRTAYEDDPKLKELVVSGQWTVGDWNMNLRYAMFLGDIHPNGLDVSADCLMVWNYRIDVFRLMREHGCFNHNSPESVAFLNVLQARFDSLHALQRQIPEAFHIHDQGFMLARVPPQLLERYTAGLLKCEDLMRARPSLFLPLVPDN